MVTGAYDRCVGDPQQAQIAIYLPDQPRGRSITTVPCRWQILLKLAGQIVDASHGIRVAIALSQDHAPGAYALTGQHSVRRILLGFTLGPVPASR